MALYAFRTFPDRLNGARTSLLHMSVQCRGALRSTGAVNEKAFPNKSANLLKVRSFEKVPRVPLLPPMDALRKPWRLGGLSTRDEICETGANLFRKYGPIVTEKFAGRYTVVHLFSPKDFHTVFQEEGDAPFRIGMAALKHYRDKVPKEYADASILHLQGQKWNRLRCATQEHLLRNQAASSYVSALNSVAQDAVDIIDDMADHRGEIPDCFYFMRRWALESITLICIGLRLGAISPACPLPSKESASILEEIMTSLHCLSAFAKTFPYYRYFPTLKWRKFQRAMDDYTA
ncbi:probable cytochrome P450 49a1 [Rhipicephalus sanguineus]|uniref:probable cytochrome P450 49a1 n=1 Tax=Rhipicephalus sanguineus TaxID=34632 RepID=UPI0020C552C8|nr:probable cytochrome P450 49a1 [Rhipicephalus sanguineus]